MYGYPNLVYIFSNWYIYTYIPTVCVICVLCVHTYNCGDALHVHLHLVACMYASIHESTLRYTGVSCECSLCVCKREYIVYTIVCCL